jgi:mono/diheme cytochrome c family protein
MFEEIVLGGARKEAGMPSFMGDITSAQVRSIHAYILQRAKESVK